MPPRVDCGYAGERHDPQNRCDGHDQRATNNRQEQQDRPDELDRHGRQDRNGRRTGPTDKTPSTGREVNRA